MRQPLRKRKFLPIIAPLIVVFGFAQAKPQSDITLSTCRLDLDEVPCSKFRLQARAAGRVFDLKQHVSNGRAAFALPIELANAIEIDLIVRTPKGSFSVPKLQKEWWDENWELGLEHPPFSREYGYLYKNKKVKCFCYLVYTNSEPGTVISTTNCE